METDSEIIVNGALHVVEEHEGWTVIEGDDGEPGRRYETKAQALREARRLAVIRGVEVVVHGSDGSVQERDMFVR